VSIKVRIKALVIALAVCGVVIASATQARELRYATGYAPGSMGAEAANNYANALKKYSDGKLTTRVYPMSLLNFMETPEGIRDGMADSGLVLTPYFPSQYPSTNLAVEISMLLELAGADPEKAGLAYAGAMSEYIFHDCPQCVAEYARQNQVFVSSGGTSPYMLLCNKPMRTLADVKGKRVRIGGAQWSRWAAELGATPVSVPQHETYEALSQGVVDCTVHSAPELTMVNLMEVVSDITPSIPGGVFAGVANNFSISTWRSLTAEERQHVLRAAAVLTAELSWAYAEAAKENIKVAETERNIRIHEPAADLVEKTREFIEKDMKSIADAYAKKYNMPNTMQMISTFQPILEKWVGLVSDIDSVEALSDLYWQETYSKVDVNTYGMKD